MKPTFLLFSTLFLTQTASNAQPIEFAPAGSVWEYQRLAYSWGPPVGDIVEVRYVDDIFVDTILCKRLSAPEGDYYIYQEGDRVYHRRDTATQFRLLWDFGVMPGDSFMIHSNGYYIGDEINIKMVCTGRDSFVENNETLPRIHLDMYCGGSWVQPITVNPRYGPMYDSYCPDYLFNTYNYCLIDFLYGFTLLNYSNTTFTTADNCLVSTTDPGVLPDIKTAPNPTVGWIQLLNLPDNATIYCYDTFGRLVTLPAGSDDTFNFSNCPNGVYVIDLQLDGQSFKRLKVLKI